MDASPRVSAEAAEALSRGGNLRRDLPNSAIAAVVVVPLTLALGGVWRIDAEPRVTLLLILVVVVATALAVVMHLRTFVIVVGPTLRWRTFGGRQREASLMDVGMPRRRGGLNPGLVVYVSGRRAFTMWTRVWGAETVHEVERRLMLNARVGVPAARSTTAG